ncbi:predicted protein [Naegleria gruberi]|uniref:Predicted protein n=1 Tax=Naegleria gruberi TaxID=5762 RepID=D2VCJ2_NAEGR|nr:uncharacterized protein NAEGRDRAFT_66590 [Naegleria gruberi]EFC45321.1 predicted protein [Naegleria gruberi]|eukprot:XP_002678065.1 predicted protein [Naegleria gruberi strain NEG-M]
MNTNNLPTDCLLYLCDFMILQLNDYCNIFLVNKHWRNSLELNNHFWLRQVCGIVKMASDDHHHSFDQLCSMVIYGNWTEFKLKYKGNVYLHKFWKRIEKLKEMSSDIELLKSAAFQVIVQFHRNASSQFQKERLKLENTHYLERFEKYHFFYQDEYQSNVNMILTIDSMFMTHFSQYWVYLIGFDTKYPNTPTRLTTMFLQKCIESKQNYCGKMASLLSFTLNSETLIGIDVENFLSTLINSLLKYFTNPSISKNHKQKLDLYQKLIDEMFLNLNEYHSGEIFVSIMKRLQSDIFPLVSKEKQQCEIVTIPKLSKQLLNIICQDGNMRENIIPFVFSNFRVESNMLQTLLKSSRDSFIVKWYYTTLRDEFTCVIYPQIEYVMGEELISFQELIQTLANHYMKRGKTFKKLLQDIQKTSCPFKMVLRKGVGLLETIEHLEYYYQLYSTNMKKDVVKEYLAEALGEMFPSMIESSGVPFAKSIVDHYKTNFHIPLHKCSKKNHDANMCFDICEILTANQNCPKNWKDNQAYFTIHPIALYLIGNRYCYGGNLDLSSFLPEYGETIITVPILIDFVRTYTGNDSSPIYSFPYSKVPPTSIRFILKKVTLKTLLENPMLILDHL